MEPLDREQGASGAGREEGDEEEDNEEEEKAVEALIGLRARYAVLAVITIAIGMAVHFHGSSFSLSPDARDILGDALWAAMMFWWVGAAVPAVRPSRRAAVTIAICVAVELSQLIRSPALESLRRTSLGHLVLGSGFDPRDFLAYAAGVFAAMLFERLLRHGRPNRP